MALHATTFEYLKPTDEQIRPQGASYKLYPPSLWPLFDACGETRIVGFGNPHKQPIEQTDEMRKQWANRAPSYDDLKKERDSLREQLKRMAEPVTTAEIGVFDCAYPIRSCENLIAARAKAGKMEEK